MALADNFLQLVVIYLDIQNYHLIGETSRVEYDNDGETLKVWNIMYIVAKDEEVALDIPSLAISKKLLNLVVQKQISNSLTRHGKNTNNI